ncbi:hypothetical protein HO133_006036 [Letharia lupina]|uniref:Uncharacterized protein n=1 Tax=Letharia lupina TaxID=560253 RepID=A0A8H6C831_9LECA|nr:uncharacterized protein HO133_006036 [Letharia lupina]KAF6218685.1 hypothetical protein HO133_006036 [Letharia lupina]
MPFPFLQLATEIRLPICRLLLPYSEYDVKAQKDDCPVRWYSGQYRCPSILLVNRQIHLEAAEILYSENFFAIYVKHPRDPRLPMNESRADPESFMFVSWAKSPEAKMNRAWAHPQNPRVPCSILGHHQSFHHIRKFHISLPSFDGLSGVDMFMKKTSFAAFNGVSAWIENCAKKGDYLDVAEKERMSIVQHFKDPIDELGRLLQTSERIDQLCVSVQASKFHITFLEYLLEELLRVGEVGGAACYFAPSLLHPHTRMLWGNLDYSQLRRWEYLLQLTPKKQREKSQLPPEVDDMYRLLLAIRTYQQLGSIPMPDWLSPMPA